MEKGQEGEGARSQDRERRRARSNVREKKPEQRDDQLSDAGRTVDRSVMSRGLAFGIAGRWQKSIPIIRSSVSSDV